VLAYFDAVRARDPERVAGQFSDDASISVSRGVFRGRPAIAAFYTGAFAEDPPDPRPSALLVDGHRVAVEVVNHRASGPVALADIFTVEDGHITSLRVYYAPVRAAD
jgi:hypothetical protein